MTATWTGWIRQDGAWEPVATGETLSECGRAIDAEVRRRGLRPHNRDMAMTATGSPPTDYGRVVAKAVAGQ